METLDIDVADRTTETNGDIRDCNKTKSTTSQQVLDNSLNHQSELQGRSKVCHEQCVKGKEPINIEVENDHDYYITKGNTHHKGQQCRCVTTRVTPYKCGGCMKAFSTICNLHRHLELSHADSELYFFDKITQTAFPRYGTSCKVTQTEAEMIQNVIVHVYGKNEGLGINADPCIKIVHSESLGLEKQYDEIGNFDANMVDKKCIVSPNNVRSLIFEHQDVTVKTESPTSESAIGDSAFVVTTTNPEEYEEESELANMHQASDENELVEEESNTSDSTVKVEMLFDDSGTLNDKKISNNSSQKLKAILHARQKRKPESRLKGKVKQAKVNLHKKSQHVKKSIFKCLICHRTFIRPYDLKRHLATHKRSPNLTCKVCAKTFTSSGRLDLHLVAHERSPPDNTCNVCEKRFVSKMLLNRHKTEMHSDAKNYMCQHCGLTFPTQYLLSRHIKKCLNMRPYACPHENCDKRYTMNYSLKVHLRNHTGELPYICELCGNKYRCSSRLNKHQKLHSYERPLKCDQCPKTFAIKDQLRRHLLTHRENKPLVCECGKSFTNNWNLKAHQRQHNGDRPYKCEVCGESFKHNVSKKNHMKMHEK